MLAGRADSMKCTPIITKSNTLGSLVRNMGAGGKMMQQLVLKSKISPQSPLSAKLRWEMCMDDRIKYIICLAISGT